MENWKPFKLFQVNLRFHLRKGRKRDSNSHRELFVWIICPKGNPQTLGHLRHLWNVFKVKTIWISPHPPPQKSNLVQSAWLTDSFKCSYQISSQMERRLSFWTSATGTTLCVHPGHYFGWTFANSPKLPLTPYFQNSNQRRPCGWESFATCNVQTRSPDCGGSLNADALIIPHTSLSGFRLQFSSFFRIFTISWYLALHWT